jgi:squalene cyclase
MDTPPPIELPLMLVIAEFSSALIAENGTYADIPDSSILLLAALSAYEEAMLDTVALSGNAEIKRPVPSYHADVASDALAALPARTALIGVSLIDVT